MSATLSIVAPVFNEEAHIGEFVDRCVAAARRADASRFELILVDDGSTDRSAQIIGEKIGQYPGQVRLVQLTRNFGQQPAYHAGLAVARGEMVVTLDSDLQDPPELIPSLVSRLAEGFDLVFGRRVNRTGRRFGASGHSGVRSLGAFVFHWMISRIKSNPLPRDVGEYRIMTRDFLNRLLEFPESLVLMSGLVAYLGYSAGFVDYVRSSRLDRSRTPLTHLVAHAADAVTMFSTAPINLVVLIGLAAWLVPLGVAGWIVARLAAGQAPTVLAWGMLAALIAWCLTLTMLIVMAHYVGRIFVETKRRPKYFIKRLVGAPIDEESLVAPTLRTFETGGAMRD